jgi:hypothetical protein
MDSQSSRPTASIIYASQSIKRNKAMSMDDTVYVVQRPKENKFGWTPDLSDAGRYGKIKILFEDGDKPQFQPDLAIKKARERLQDFGPNDYILWAGGGDPIAVMIACTIASEMSDEVNILRWERNANAKSTDTQVGFYMPVTLNLG